jgi:hypothetical protein
MQSGVTTASSGALGAHVHGRPERQDPREPPDRRRCAAGMQPWLTLVSRSAPARSSRAGPTRPSPPAKVLSTFECAERPNGVRAVRAAGIARPQQLDDVDRAARRRRDARAGCRPGTSRRGGARHSCSLWRVRPDDDAVAVRVHLHRARSNPAEAPFGRVGRKTCTQFLARSAHEEGALRPVPVLLPQDEQRALRVRRAVDRDLLRVDEDDTADAVLAPRQRLLRTRRFGTCSRAWHPRRAASGAAASPCAAALPRVVVVLLGGMVRPAGTTGGQDRKRDPDRCPHGCDASR